MSSRAYRRHRAEHGHKIVHSGWWPALLHALDLTMRRRTALWLPYRCTWGPIVSRGRTAPEHWHVGRRRWMRRAGEWFKVRTEHGWAEWFKFTFICQWRGHRWYPVRVAIVCDRCLKFREDL